MKFNNLCIYSQLGLGDHIITNAIIREKAKQYDLVCLPVKYHNCASVAYMLRDLDNVTIRPCEDADDAWFFTTQVWMGNTLVLGPQGPGWDANEWDVSLYRQAGVEFSDRWNKWHCERDEVAEEKLLDHVRLQTKFSTDEHRVFWHEDESRGLKIKISKLPDDAKATPASCFIGPGPITPIQMHWRKVIEACDEIHCIVSSFSVFIDSIPLPKQPKLYLHAYARGNEPLPKYIKDWSILR